MPALPVKPLMNILRSKHVGTYSLKWGSCEGTRNASTPAAFIAARMATSFGSEAMAVVVEPSTSTSLAALDLARSCLLGLTRRDATAVASWEGEWVGDGARLPTIGVRCNRRRAEARSIQSVPVTGELLL